MPILNCYVDERTLAVLQRVSFSTGRTVEQLAEAAIESEAIREAGGPPGMHWTPPTVPLDLGGVTIAMRERPDGSIEFRA